MNRPLRKTLSFALGLLTVLACPSLVRAQDTQDQSAPPTAEVGTSIENPPLSGLDLPSFEPGYGARSYLQPKLQLSEAADSNPNVRLGSSVNFRQVTRALGAVDLQKLWKFHPFDLSYVGGIAHYYGLGQSNYQVHSLAATQRFLWRTGRLALRDSFRYMPQGSFGFNSFGGAGGFSGGGVGSLGGGTGTGGLGGSGGGIAEGGSGGAFAGSQLGSLGNFPRISNMAIADITQDLNPRTAVVFSGGFGVVDFVNSPTGYINSQLAVGEAGYNYRISKRDQIALTYAYQEYHFPRLGSGSFNVHSGRFLYGHRITGRLEFRMGGGPQWIHVYGYQQITPGTFVPDNRSYISGTGNMSVNYRVSPRSSVTLEYLHYTNPGSGFFAGADSDRVSTFLTHSLTRRWTSVFSGGYSRNTRILARSTPVVNNARTYQYWFVGSALRRQLGEHWGAFVSYQYDRLNLGAGVCTVSNPNCATRVNRHVALIGLDWTPRPIRLD